MSPLLPVGKPLACPSSESQRDSVPQPRVGAQRLFHIEPNQSLTYPPTMSMSIEQLAEEALALPSEARALLADRLAESLDPAADEHFRKLWAAEAIRRRDEVHESRVQTIPGDEALARVRQKSLG